MSEDWVPMIEVKVNMERKTAIFRIKIDIIFKNQQNILLRKQKGINFVKVDSQSNKCESPTQEFQI